MVKYMTEERETHKDGYHSHELQQCEGQFHNVHGPQ